MNEQLPDGLLSDLYREDPIKACRKALRLTREISFKDRLEVIDRILGMHGTEAINGDWQNGYWGDIVAVYCNTGDTYGVTVMQQRGKYRGVSSRFFVSAMGDWVEKNARKFGVE